jgi:CHRD domain-containing protein
VRLYRVELTGKADIPKGAANATGWAVIAIHRDSTVCWRFAHLHGFFDATLAQLHVGLSGAAGRVAQRLSTGPRLRHRGCVRTSPATVRAIELDPSNYYVDVQSKLYPAGAIRGQL